MDYRDLLKIIGKEPTQAISRETENKEEESQMNHVVYHKERVKDEKEEKFNVISYS